MSEPGRSSGQSLTSEQESLLLDATQLILDLVGVFEPTPFADGTNALISLGRKDWLGATLSAISILPYLGDAAKLGKLPKYSRSINKAITLAGKDAAFAEKLRPILRQLKKLLDDVPTGELPGTLRQLKQRISRFLDGAPRTTGPVLRALQTLPPHLRAGFLQAMKLKPLRNPRKLRKRPGPVDEDSLLEELFNKGFIRVKSGRHSPQKMDARRRAVEDSDIYLRRVIGENGQDSFEVIRVDRKFGGGTSRPFGHTRDGIAPSPGARRGVLSPADVQRSDKQFRRLHHTLATTSDKAGKAAGGGRTLSETGRRRMINELQDGSKKGEFSHWHHEEIPAVPADLAQYLQGPLRGKTRKFDSMGQEVGTW